jgi:hypothetical protein
MATVVAVAYRICGRHWHILVWCGRVESTHSWRTNMLYATVVDAVMAYRIFVRHGSDGSQKPLGLLNVVVAYETTVPHE